MNWDGLLLINKPQAETSHTIVQIIKNRLKVEKAGHLGTLDPIATGVFPVCLGKATRLTPFYMGADKCYLAAIHFGYFTTTDDREGRPEGPVSKIRFSKEQLERVISSFQGDFQQKPPAFSAKKIKGKKAYELARMGIKPDLPIQKVSIHDIRLMHFEKDTAVVYIHCGTGTYVRAIARELGLRLRCGAHVKDLARTQFSQFRLEECSDPDSPLEKLRTSFIPLSEMLNDFPEIALDDAMAKKILNGSSVDVEGPFDKEWVKVFDEKNNLLAFAKVETGEKNLLQPKIVFN